MKDSRRYSIYHGLLNSSTVRGIYRAMGRTQPIGQNFFNNPCPIASTVTWQTTTTSIYLLSMYLSLALCLSFSLSHIFSRNICEQQQTFALVNRIKNSGLQNAFKIPNVIIRFHRIEIYCQRNKKSKNQ